MGEAVFIGCAGWSLPKAYAGEFPAEGTHLQRYAQRLSCVEINSSFYRPHRTSTYERWAGSTPDGFRFAVKAPKEITHVRRLLAAEAPLEKFLGEVAGLGSKLGALLVQLPPSLAFERDLAEGFFLRPARPHVHGDCLRAAAPNVVHSRVRTAVGRACSGSRGGRSQLGRGGGGSGRRARDSLLSLARVAADVLVGLRRGGGRRFGAAHTRGGAVGGRGLVRVRQHGCGGGDRERTGAECAACRLRLERRLKVRASQDVNQARRTA